MTLHTTIRAPHDREARVSVAEPPAAPDALRVLGICGSLRPESYNRLLLNTARQLAPRGMEVRILDLEPIPFFRACTGPAGTPECVRAMLREIEEADALLFATPEHNYGIPAVLANALEWASQPPRASVLRGKPAAIIGASTGMGGTIRAQMQLRQAFLYTEVHALLQPELMVSRVQDKVSDDGSLCDRFTLDRLSSVLTALAEWTHRLTGSRRLAESPL